MSAAQETEHSTDDTPLHSTDSHNANADSCQDDTETGDIGKANDAYQANASTAGKAAEADNAAALNSLATRPVGALLWQYSVPAVAGMVVVSLYNVIDRIFIGRGVGPDAISGLAITFPLMNLSTALGVLVGAGASARVSIMLGAKRLREAQTILGNSLVMLLIFATIYITTFAVFLDPLLRAFGASDRTLPYAHDFMSVLLPGMLLMNLSFSLNNIQRASGYPRRAMMTMILSAVANAILAPIFIFGLDMGIRGAALATDLAMAGTLVFVLWHFFDRRSNLHFTSGTYRLRRTVVISIIGIGAAPSLVNAASSLINFLINNTMYAYGGDNAVGAAGIFSTYASLITMIIIGICQGMQPVVGYNYGAGKLHRLRRAYILTLAGRHHTQHPRLVRRHLYPRSHRLYIHHRRRLGQRHRTRAQPRPAGLCLRRISDSVHQLFPKHRPRWQVHISGTVSPGPLPHPAATHYARDVGAERRMAFLPHCRPLRHRRHRHPNNYGIQEITQNDSR